MYSETIAIIGVGLLGGSIGLAARERKLARRIIGIGRRAEMLRKAEDRWAVTETTTELAKGVAEADLVIVCTPVASVVEQVRQAAEACGPRTVITDVGSTKAAIVAGAEQALAGREGVWASFVGSHPLAGSEKTGVEFARDDLFVGRTVVVTPTDHTRPEATEKIERFWQALGARTLRMSPADHDEAVAMTSHLPHLIAAAMAAITPEDNLPLTGPGWRDTTRIAGGDVQLWRQILADNRVHTLSALAQFEKLLSDYRQALETNDGPAIARLLAQGKSIRDALGS